MSRYTKAATVSFAKFVADDCMTLAASLAFYTLFALPPLMFLLVVTISTGMLAWYEADVAREHANVFLQQQIRQLIGDRAAAQEVARMMQFVADNNGNWWRSVISTIGVLVGATGVMTALQSSLNHVWNVVRDPNKSFVLHFMLKRIVSLALIMGLGFVLLVSLIVSTVMGVMTSYAARQFGVEGWLPAFVNHALTAIVSWIFFVGIYRFMPDARVSYRHAFIGSAFTVVLFSIGRAALLAWFYVAEPGQQLGSAAGAVAIVLLWVYYSSFILLYGAEFTAALAIGDGEELSPKIGAVQKA